MNEGKELTKDNEHKLVPVESDVKIETEATKWLPTDVGPGILTVDLPCGFIDDEGGLHDTITVGEMTGNEEDILAGKGSVVARLNQIIANCTRQFGKLTDRREMTRAVWEMAAPDRLAALLAIRRASLGDYYGAKIPCPNVECKEVSRFTLNLSETEIIRMKDQRTRSRKDEFADGKFVSWHIMTADDEEWLSGKRKRKEDVITLALLSRVDAVDIPDGKGGMLHQSLDRDNEKDKKGYRDALKALKSLSIRERNSIRSLFSEHEGAVDTEVDFVCPACQQEWRGDMEVGQTGFFFPSDK